MKYLHVPIKNSKLMIVYNKMKKQADNSLSHRNALNSQFYTQSHEDKIAEDAARLLMEDPSIYAYDEIYDDMKQKQKKNTQKIQKQAPQPTKKQQSKYIKSIISTVGKREREHEIVNQRMASKKAKRQGADGIEAFVTAGYLKELEARKKYEQQQQKAEDYNQKHSIVNKNKDVYEFTAEFLKNEMHGTQQSSKEKDVNSNNALKVQQTSVQAKKEKIKLIEHKDALDIKDDKKKQLNLQSNEQKHQNQRIDPFFQVDPAAIPKPTKFFSQKAHQERMRLKQQQEAQKAKNRQ